MSDAETDRQALSFMTDQGQSNRALAKSAAAGSWGQRYCNECLREDLTSFGEAYWHREHNLPFALLCRKHGTPLCTYVSDSDLVARRGNGIRRLPETYLGSVRERPISTVMAQAFNRLNHELINRRIRRSPKEWLRRYRSKASAMGLANKGKGLASLSFAKAFHDFFGDKLLLLSDLDYEIGTLAWPALMLREKQEIPFSTPKHVLLQTFLAMGETPNGEVEYRRPGVQSRDYPLLDRKYEQLVRRAVQKIQQKDVRVEVADLLRGLGIWHVFRHHRSQLPKTCTLLAEFRNTKWSARQVGRRPRKYK